MSRQIAKQIGRPPQSRKDALEDRQRVRHLARGRPPLLRNSSGPEEDRALSQIAGVAGHLFVTMNLYSTLVFLHVVTAIFGLGPLASLAAVTTRPSSASIPAKRVARILRLVRWSLLGMFLTGAAIIALTHGALGHVLWMRVSIGLFVLLGLLHGVASRQIRRALNGSTPAILPKALSPLLWSMCGLVATITYLMEAKPW